jgi:hypothetical protein
MHGKNCFTIEREKAFELVSKTCSLQFADFLARNISNKKFNTAKTLLLGISKIILDFQRNQKDFNISQYNVALQLVDSDSNWEIAIKSIKKKSQKS